MEAGEPSTLGYDSNQVVFAGSSRYRLPLLRYAAIAAVQSDSTQKIADWICKSFNIDLKDWHLICAKAAMSDAMLQKEQRKSFPPRLRTKPLDKEEALHLGATSEAIELADWCEQLPQTFPHNVRAFETSLRVPREDNVSEIVQWLIRPGIYKIVKTVLFHFHNELAFSEISSISRIRLYRGHPWIARAGMADYIKCILSSDNEFSAKDLLTCLFQHLSHQDGLSNAVTIEDIQNSKSLKLVYRLKRADAWAEAKLGLWIQRNCTASAIARCRLSVKNEGCWQDPRKNRDLTALMDSAATYLETEWNEEISEIIWKSEEIAFQALLLRLRGSKVEKHARPIWLAPQHLDIFLPDYNIAVEYMGLQHYQAVDFFGGEEALRLTIERDARKAKLCSAAGIRLEYIRYDEDISARIV